MGVVLAACSGSRSMRWPGCKKTEKSRSPKNKKRRVSLKPGRLHQYKETFFGFFGGGFSFFYSHGARFCLVWFSPCLVIRGSPTWAQRHKSYYIRSIGKTTLDGHSQQQQIGRSLADKQRGTPALSVWSSYEVSYHVKWRRQPHGALDQGARMWSRETCRSAVLPRLHNPLRNSRRWGPRSVKLKFRRFPVSRFCPKYRFRLKLLLCSSRS